MDLYWSLFQTGLRVSLQRLALLAPSADQVEIVACDSSGSRIGHATCPGPHTWPIAYWPAETLDPPVRTLPPAAASWPPLAAGAPARLHIFAVAAGDLDGQLLHLSRGGDTWTSAPLPGQRNGWVANCGPAVVANAAGLTDRLDVFAVGRPDPDPGGARTLQHWWINGPTPDGPERLGGRLWDVSPCVVARGDARATGVPSIDVLAIADDGTLQHWGYTDRWTGPTPHGGHLANGTSPAAVSWGGDRLDVFAVAEADPRTIQHWWVNGTDWYGPETLDVHTVANPHGVTPVSLEAAPPCALSTGPGTVDVFATTTPPVIFGSRQLQHLTYTDADGWALAPSVDTGLANAGPAGCVRHAVETKVIDGLPIRRAVTRVDIAGPHDTDLLNPRTDWPILLFADPDYSPPPPPRPPRPLTILGPATLPVAYLYQEYEQQFGVLGAVNPTSWSVDPAGGFVDSHFEHDSGRLYFPVGQVTTPGDYAFTVSVADSGNPQTIGRGIGSRAFTLPVRQGGPPPPPGPTSGHITLTTRLAPGDARDVSVDLIAPVLSRTAPSGSGWGIAPADTADTTTTLDLGRPTGPLSWEQQFPLPTGHIAGSRWRVVAQAQIQYADLTLTSQTVECNAPSDGSVPTVTVPPSGSLNLLATMSFLADAQPPRWEGIITEGP